MNSKKFEFIQYKKYLWKSYAKDIIASFQFFSITIVMSLQIQNRNLIGYAIHNMVFQMQ